MANSLQEQLLKAGLTNEKKAKKAKKSNKKNRDLKREVKAAVEEKRHAEQQKAKELNQQIQQEVKNKEIQAQILQLIEMNQLSLSGEVKYNFTDGSKIKNILVDDKTQTQLANGLLAIVRFKGDYAVIPGVVADKIAMRDDACIVSQSVKEEIDEDDPYADYVIPDDLMW
jgi:uncharacterized protein YaiL (DUF2058 family)